MEPAVRRLSIAPGGSAALPGRTGMLTALKVSVGPGVDLHDRFYR
ncbi:hypothetical protein ACFWPA_13705 [Rhodococcus sp. NPDC058505]